MMTGGIDSILNNRMAAGRQDPQYLMNSYQQNQDLIDLLALQKLKSEKEAAARQMMLQGGGTPPTVREQREQELVQMNKNELAQQVGGVAQKQMSDQQQAMQKLLQGIGGQNTPSFANGGIVGYQAGGDVDPRLERLTQQLIDAGMEPEAARASAERTLNRGLPTPPMPGLPRVPNLLPDPTAPARAAGRGVMSLIRNLQGRGDNQFVGPTLAGAFVGPEEGMVGPTTEKRRFGPPNTPNAGKFVGPDLGDSVVGPTLEGAFVGPEIGSGNNDYPAITPVTPKIGDRIAQELRLLGGDIAAPFRREAERRRDTGYRPAQRQPLAGIASVSNRESERPTPQPAPQDMGPRRLSPPERSTPQPAPQDMGPSATQRQWFESNLPTREEFDTQQATAQPAAQQGGIGSLAQQISGLQGRQKSGWDAFADWAAGVAGAPRNELGQALAGGSRALSEREDRFNAQLMEMLKTQQAMDLGERGMQVDEGTLDYRREALELEERLAELGFEREEARAAATEAQRMITQVATANRIPPAEIARIYMGAFESAKMMGDSDPLGAAQEAVERYTTIFRAYGGSAPLTEMVGVGD